MKVDAWERGLLKRFLGRYEGFYDKSMIPVWPTGVSLGLSGFKEE